MNRRKKPKNLIGTNGIVVQLAPRFNFIEVFNARLYPKAARILSKRLIEMAEYLETAKQPGKQS